MEPARDGHGHVSVDAASLCDGMLIGGRLDATVELANSTCSARSGDVPVPQTGVRCVAAEEERKVQRPMLRTGVLCTSLPCRRQANLRRNPMVAASGGRLVGVVGWNSTRAVRELLMNRSERDALPTRGGPGALLAISPHESFMAEDGARMFETDVASSRAKRFLDLVVVVVAAPVVLIVGCVLAILIKTSSSGPVLFRQKRVGADGVPFEMLKFRTMRSDSEAILRAGPRVVGSVRRPRLQAATRGRPAAHSCGALAAPVEP